MVGLNKFDAKDRRRQRRSYQRNHIAHDLQSPKYRQRVVERKRIDNEDGSYWFDDYQYLDEVDDDL